MSRVRSRNSKLDLRMKHILEENRIAFEIYPRIFGNPDFLVGKKVVLFCDSAFWHGRNWTRLRRQLSEGNNSEYWISHILGNRRRDREVNKVLKRQGYVVLRLWDKEIQKEPSDCLEKIASAVGEVRSTTSLRTPSPPY